MLRTLLPVHLAPLVLAGGLAGLPGAGTTLFVDDTAAPGGDGSSWSAAFADLQDALDAARADAGVTAIRVAEGLYLPDRGTGDPALSFELVSGVEILGGFPDGGGPPASRDPLAHETVLSGDLLGDDGEPDGTPFLPGLLDNVHHVVRALAPGPGTSLDGLVVRGGNTLAVGGADGSGGGVLVEGGELALRGCRVERSAASQDGGGLAARDAALTLDGCTFTLNRAHARGGGAALLGGVDSLVRGCVFQGNFGGSGAGLAIAPVALLAPGAPSSDTRVEDSRFEGNLAVLGSTAGGGLFIEGMRPLVRDSRFFGNSANGGGGAFVHDGSARFERCLFRGNDNVGDGGGGFNATSFSGFVAPPTELISCSFVGNNGGIYAGGLDVVLVNATVADNRLPDLLPFELWPAVISTGGSDVELFDSIVWGNAPLGTNGDESDHLVVLLGSGLAVTRCLVENWAGVLPGSAVALDPRFEDPLGPDGDPQTTGDNVYRLRADSPAVDRGVLSALFGAPALDVERRPRVADGDGDGFTRIDLGAYERRNPFARLVKRLQTHATNPTPLGSGLFGL